MNKTFTPSRHRIAQGVMLLCASVSGIWMQAAHGGTTDIADQPLATRPSVQAKPNLLFVLDDSGSMSWSYMPDDLGNNGTASSTWYGYWSAQCNGVAYDPSTTYSPPVDASGNSYANASFTAAKTDGYISTSSTVNLGGTSYNYYYTYHGQQPKMGWIYTTLGVNTDTPFYSECSSVIGNIPGSDVFTKVTVSSTSAEAQNYANWYSYYRKRYLLMRTAMGRAMKGIDSSYRVGFSTINDTSATDGTNLFRDVKDFDSTQKANFYSSLYTATPNSGTPLRVALSKAGQYFAKKASGQTYDPVQYSCQRNYALLSTDGYWNGNGGTQLNGTTAIGQQDGTDSRPMRDETKLIVTTVQTKTAPATQDQILTQTNTLPWTRTATKVASSKGGKCSNTQYQITTTPQTYNEILTRTVTSHQSGTASYTITTITTDGEVTSGPTNGTVTYSAWTNLSTDPATTPTDNGAPTTSSTYTNGTAVYTCQSSKGTGTTTYTAATAGSWSGYATTGTTTANLVIGTYTTSGATDTQTTSGGTSNTLADVAEYYYKTDLRTSDLGNCSSNSSGNTMDVCNNIVRTNSDDPATWQHMNTFTIGLGVSGTLTYDQNYKTQTTGDYINLTNGTKYWPAPGSDKGAVNIDDLWHAAVNGRGLYYSALNADALREAINGVVTSVQQTTGASSAASTSALELVSGDNNKVFRASYTTQSWTGDVLAYTLNGTTATISNTPLWSAQTQLDQLALASRKVYFNKSGTLTSFTYDNLSSAQDAYFTGLCDKTEVVAAQCASLDSTNKPLANDGSNLVNYLRGDRTHESATSSATALYRKRAHLLGDIINGAPVYVGKPPFGYSDSGYADFVIAKTSRKPMVYTAANDGMLHAFSADTSDGGAEKWAFIPTAVMPNLYKLADTSYESRHQYFVDGAPVIGDIKVGDAWKTILVGGLNKGGSSYYALDITDPANPHVLWEYTNANMGMTFGNPVIAKRADGTWIVAFTSGYNNTAGDGKGHLYILNANTGAKLLEIATTAGSTSTPSGLTKLNAWVDSATDNTAKRFYSGDLLGNVWRFDIDSLVEPKLGALKLATLQIDNSTPQPITTKPQLLEAAGKPVVIVATGRYLGEGDITDTTQQSVYGIKDPLTNTGWGDVHHDTTNFVKQTITLNGTEASATSAKITNNTVDWESKGGWWFDLPHSKERVAGTMGLQLTTLVIGSAIPNGDACASGGSSWRYYINAVNGGYLINENVGSLWSKDTLLVGLSWIKDVDGNVRIITQGSDGSLSTDVPPALSSSGASTAHRTSWRELVD